jgi:outer membrane protein assembly factor BamB
MRIVFLAVRLGFSLVTLLAISTMHAADVLTQHSNNARTGAVLDETLLTTNSVKSARFGKLWTLYTDGQVVAQPLYVSRLSIDTTQNPTAPRVTGTFNAVVIATMHNTVYVYNADEESKGPNGRTVPLWATWLGQPRVGSKEIDMWSTNDPEWGILSTPVISPDKSTLYVVAWHDDGQQGLQYRLHALNMRDGTARHPAVPIGPSSKDTPQPCKPQNAFNPCVHKQRAALLLSNGVIYIAFGGDGNRGALFAFDATTLTQRALWNSTPTGQDGGIWQSGQGPAADDAGNIYLMTGNGTFDAGDGRNFGNSFVKLKLDGQAISVVDFFTPCNFKFLNDRDLDLGSGGPALLPTNPLRILGGGKEGMLYVLSQTNMGKFVADPAAPNCKNTNALQTVKAFEQHVFDGETHWGNIHGSPVYWQGPDSGRIYIWGENGRLKSYPFNQGKIQEVGVKEGEFRPPNGMPGGMLALSANGNKTGSGIIWAVVPLDGDANRQRGVKGVVIAADAQDITRTLWTSEQFAERDRLGLFAKFSTPLVTNGKVFIATYGNDEPLRTFPPNSRPDAFPKNYSVAVYGLLPPQQMTHHVVDQDNGDITVVRATTGPLTLDTTKCKPSNGAMDCTDTLAESANAPSFHKFLLPADGNTQGCLLVRVTTASKTAAIANANGVGFWSSLRMGGDLAAGDSGRFVPKSQLKSSGTAMLLNGETATLHEFVGVSSCGGGAEAPSRIFKLYMQFEGAPDGTIFHNWDLAPNYRIGPDVSQFDRSNNVLSH